MWILDNNPCIHCTVIGTMRNVMITIHNLFSVGWSEVHFFLEISKPLSLAMM